MKFTFASAVTLAAVTSAFAVTGTSKKASIDAPQEVSHFARYREYLQHFLHNLAGGEIPTMQPFIQPIAAIGSVPKHDQIYISAVFYEGTESCANDNILVELVAALDARCVTTKNRSGKDIAYQLTCAEEIKGNVTMGINIYNGTQCVKDKLAWHKDACLGVSSCDATTGTATGYHPMGHSTIEDLGTGLVNVINTHVRPDGGVGMAVGDAMTPPEIYDTSLMKPFLWFGHAAASAPQLQASHRTSEKKEASPGDQDSPSHPVNPTSPTNAVNKGLRRQTQVPVHPSEDQSTPHNDVQDQTVHHWGGGGQEGGGAYQHPPFNAYYHCSTSFPPVPALQDSQCYFALWFEHSTLPEYEDGGSTFANGLLGNDGIVAKDAKDNKDRCKDDWLADMYVQYSQKAVDKAVHGAKPCSAYTLNECNQLKTYGGGIYMKEYPGDIRDRFPK